MPSSASSSSASAGSLGNLVSIPIMKDPVDVLRDGPHSLLSRQAVVHPVQLIQKHSAFQADQSHKATLAKIYGRSMPMKLIMEERVLAQYHRLPGLPSSHVGLETLLGLDEEIEFGDYLNLKENDPMLKCEPHVVFEQKFNKK